MKFAVFLVLCYVQSALCAKILGFFPIPSISHQLVFRGFMRELSKRGHQVTVATPDPTGMQNDNYTEIDLHFIYTPFREEFPDLYTGVPEKPMWEAYELLVKLIDLELSHDGVQKVLREGSFDLVVVELLLVPAVTALSHHFKVPLVGIASLDLIAPTHELIGNPFNPAYYPELLLPYTDKKDFYARFRSTISYLFWKLAYKYRWLPKHDAIAKKHFGPDTPYVGDIEKNVSMVFAYTDFRTSYPFPMVPAYVQIGGGRPIHMADPKPLPKVFAPLFNADRFQMAVCGFLVFGLVLCAKILDSNGSDILAIFPTPSFSHQIVYRSYLLELSRRGHNITVITTDPVGNPALKNYREIDMSAAYEAWNKRFDVASDKAKFLRWVPELLLFAFSEFMDDMCHRFLSHPEVNELIRDNVQFDLFVVEFGVSSCFYPFSRQSRNNYIGIFSMSPMSFVHANVGNSATPSYLPDPLLGELSGLSFPKRMRATIFQAAAWIVYYRTMRNHHEIARNYFGADLPPLDVYERNVSILLLNDHFTVTFPRPTVPAAVDVGGPALQLLKKPRTPTSLPEDLQRFLDDAKEGVIYFSLGSNVKSNAMPPEKREIFLRAFSRIKQKVLWKWEADVLPGKPDNVKIAKWLPQTDVLAHPNVKAFITQGGLQSVSEAVYFTVPMIVIPFFADQELNSKKLASEGVGIRVEYENLEMESFLAALQEITNNPGYKERIVKYAALTQDQPQSPLDRAVWWTEYVIRHKGAKHLRSAAVDMPWYQYFLLDVFAFIIAVLSVAFYVFYKLLCFVLRLVFGRNKAKKD